MKQTKKSYLKIGGVAIMALFLTACTNPFAKDKTEAEVLKAFNQQITSDVRDGLTMASKMFKPQYKGAISLELKALDINEHPMASAMGVDIEKAIFNFTETFVGDERDLDNLRYNMGLTLNGEFAGKQQGQTVSGKTDGAGMVQLADDAIWLKLTKASTESSLLPMAVTPPSTLLNKWFKLAYADIDAKLKEAELDITVVEFLKTNSNMYMLSNMKEIAKRLESLTILKLKNTDNAEKIASISDDGDYYVLDVELDRVALVALVKDFEDYMMKSIDPVVPVESTTESDIPDLKGKLYVSNSNSDLFKFEGVVDGDTFTIDYTQKGLYKFVAKDEEGTVMVSFTKNGSKYQYEVPTEEVVVDGAFTDKMTTIKAMVKGEEALIVDLRGKNKSYTGTISVPALPSPKILIKVNSLKATAKDFNLDFIVNADDIDLGQLKLSMKTDFTKSAKVTSITEAAEDIDLDALSEKIGGAMMGGMMSNDNTETMTEEEMQAMMEDMSANEGMVDTEK